MFNTSLGKYPDNDTAYHMWRYIRSHAVEAHITLTNMIRAQLVYTYWDDNHMRCTEAEWILIDPRNLQEVEEFLGY